jgi:hypothetical protein
MLGLAVLATAGCAGVHQCVIPERPLVPTTAEPLPLHVGVAYADGLPGRAVTIRYSHSSFTLPVGAAAVAAFNAVLPQLFATASDGRAPRPAQGGADALLSIDVGDVHARPGPFRPERVELTAAAVLVERTGAELARVSVPAAAEGEPVHHANGFPCDALGSALSGALADAAARVRDELAASPRLRAWARDRAAGATALAAGSAATGPAAPEGAPPPLPAPPPQPEARSRWLRPWPIPRYLGGGFTYGKVTGSAPGIGTREGPGWNIYSGWDLTRWLDAGFRGGAIRTRVGWTPNPADTDSPAGSGFFGVGLLARLRPGRIVDPWIAGDLAYHSVNWDSYLYSVGGWGWVGSAGVDLHVWRFGAVRVGVSYAGFGATTWSGYGQTGPTPGPEDDGATSSMETLWLTAAWIFDFGPAR